MVRRAIGLVVAALLAHGGTPALAEDAFAAAARAAAVEALGAIDRGGIAGVTCPGDCNGDGQVSVNELVRAVAIAVGVSPLGECAVIDTSGNGSAEVGELVAAVGSALNGCGGGEGSVCGGPVTSAPKLCDLTITPKRTTAFGTIRISFAISDLEGDLTQICGALAEKSEGQPTLDCDPIDAEPEPVNAILELPAITLMGAANGTYVLYLQLRDSRGRATAVVSAEFVVGVRV